MPILAFAQVTFEAKFRKDKIALNETVYVDFVMNKDTDDITIPKFKNFEIISGPTESNSESVAILKHYPI